MLLFMEMCGLSAHLHDVLVMDRHEVIQQVLARLQQKGEHQGIAFVVGESLEVCSTIAFGQLEEVVEASGGASLCFKRIDTRLRDGLVTLQIGLNRGDSGCRGVFFEVVKGRALLTFRHREQSVNGLAQRGCQALKHRLKKLSMHCSTAMDNEPLQDRRTGQEYATV